jgi:hypothetical protein
VSNNIIWIDPSPPNEDDGDTQEFHFLPNLYKDWGNQVNVTMFHSVSHKRIPNVRRYSPRYRIMLAQGWVELEQS